MRNNSEKLFFEFEPVVQEEMSYKNIFIWSSGGLFVQRGKTIFAIYIEGIKRNNSMELL